MPNINNKIAYITLFHSSDYIIEMPIFGEGKSYNDYGKRFYCTEHVEACATGSDGYANRNHMGLAGLSVINLNALEYNILNWLAILLKNRKCNVADGFVDRLEVTVMWKSIIRQKRREYAWSSWQEYLNDNGEFPTQCDTRVMLKRITLDNLKGLVDEPLDGDITDVEYTTNDRLTDDDTRQFLLGYFHFEYPTNLQQKEKTERNEKRIKTLLYGAPLRQLSD